MIGFILLYVLIINVKCEITPIVIDEILSINETKEFLNELKRIKTTNVEELLIKEEPILIWYRNITYSGAVINNITCHSSNEERLFYIKKIIKWVYNTIDPKDEYTKNTDVSHWEKVYECALELFPDKNFSLPLIVSIWFHDIERYIPSTRIKSLSNKVDPYRKQYLHPLTSVEVTKVLLNGSPLSNEEKHIISRIIIQHDKPLNDIIRLKNVTLLDIPSDDIKEEVEILAEADALVFFSYTLLPFIISKLHKGNKWIWQRIISNLRKLKSSSRLLAIEYIDNLALNNTISQMMGYDKEEIIRRRKALISRTISMHDIHILTNSPKNNKNNKNVNTYFNNLTKNTT